MHLFPLIAPQHPKKVRKRMIPPIAIIIKGIFAIWPVILDAQTFNESWYVGISKRKLFENYLLFLSNYQYWLRNIHRTQVERPRRAIKFKQEKETVIIIFYKNLKLVKLTPKKILKAISHVFEIVSMQLIFEIIGFFFIF